MNRFALKTKIRNFFSRIFTYKKEMPTENKPKENFWDAHSSAITGLSSIALVIVTAGLVYYGYQSHADTASIINQNQTLQRPYIHVVPDTGVNAFGLKLMDMKDDSNVPGKLVYIRQLAGITDANFYSQSYNPSSTHELYQLNPLNLYGGQTSPLNFPVYEVSSTEIQQFETGQIAYIVASCIIYKTLNPNDSREWEDDEVWTFRGPGGNIATAWSSQDNPVINETQCNPDSFPSEIKFQ
jgi:hypothetical protein